MGYVLFGAIIGLTSAVGCALFGQITWGEGALIYWIMGTSAPVLHGLLGVTAPSVAQETD